MRQHRGAIRQLGVAAVYSNPGPVRVVVLCGTEQAFLAWSLLAVDLLTTLCSDVWQVWYKSSEGGQTD